MGIFDRESIEVRRQKGQIRDLEHYNSSIKKSIKRLEKDRRKMQFKTIVHKLAAKPISKSDGMEMMFGTKDFKNNCYGNRQRGR